MPDRSILRIDLDSNVFRNQDFINWLILNKEAVSAGLSVIVYLETLFWYLTKSLSVADFELDLRTIRAVITPLDPPLAQITAETAKNSLLPFRHHARDFIIGSSALKRKAILLSYNSKNFTWMPEDTVTSPESFLDKYWDSFPYHSDIS
ncbi:MAG: hypothetical protein ACE5R6_15635 [Candidatus Heimdallarchaeota archaeon]